MNLLVSKEIGEKVICYGFSAGAYSLLKLASVTTIDKIILVSPSPFFPELIGGFDKEDKKYLFIENMKETLHEVCSLVKSKEVEVYVGEKETDFMKETAKLIANEFGVQLNVVEGMQHDEKLFNKVLEK